jgi:arsenate reductase (glutaredoxin)
MAKTGAVTLYGIPNCDTVKKARAWLERQGVGFRFHDFRADGLDRKSLEAWVKQLGWEKVLNKASTTFRDLPDKKKVGLDETRAIALMLESPTMIKRPVLDRAGSFSVGFKPDVYAALFGG